MKKLFFLFINLLFFIPITTQAQTDPVVDKIIEIGKTDNQSMQHLDVLCNRFGGRLIGSDAYENAAEWAAYKFREWGMEVEFDEAGEIPVGFNRGPWFGRMLGEEGMNLHFATPSYTSGTKGVQRGEVLIEPKTQAEFDRMKGALKGKWVLISGENKGYPIDFSENADILRDSIKAENAKIEEENNKIRRENWQARGTDQRQKELLPLIEEPALFYKEMRDAGILGIIQSSKTPIQAMYDRKNTMDMTWETLPTVPDIKLDAKQFSKIKRMAEERRYFLLEFDIRNHFKIGPIKYHNVIGIIRGTEFPDEYVIMGGHLDAYDVATGGVDDGSGVTPTMEAARLIMEAGGQPKRTILVVLWAGEEFGLLGSQSWIDRNADKYDKVSNMVNRDGGPTVPTGVSVSPAMMADFEAICAPINDINPDFPFEITEREAREKPKKAWGTDSGPFAVEGIPTIGFKCEDPKGYNFSYSEIWHTERDLYNKSIPEYQEHAAICTAVMVYGIANLDHLLSRDGYYIEKPSEEKSEGKSKRAKEKRKAIKDLNKK
ncbi:M28 family peptidase [Lentimicrobium sp. S6]|uniref:M28 family peptidase n=1 Tax=Lentimicrobium sp. S6 TaxID=2735872 RepID=UPI001554995E|nr:M28 family peptidase [Lentimicrobium sp. S6]NPD45864.1 M20/M25/M40 family metallo-hydrolase [Lentimicrobium sp. S6]